MAKEVKIVASEEAVKVVKSGERVHFSGVAGFPHKLSEALYQRGMAGELKDVTVQYIHNVSHSPFAGPENVGIFNLEVVYVGDNIRKNLQAGFADYIPIQLSETHLMMDCASAHVDVAMVMVSEPDKHGFVSLGASVDINPTAIATARCVIAAINPNVPRTFGDASLHIDDIDIFTYDDTALPEAIPPEPNEVDNRISAHCASLIEDGATLQLGIGSLPNAILTKLTNHKDIGIHTEMLSEGILPLYESGVINNSQKRIDRGKIVASFLMGSRKLYDFSDNNPALLMKDVLYTNNPAVIAQNPKVVSINAALAVDLTGQVSAESIGTLQYSGCGGQLDFVQGANASEGGKSIIALHSTTKSGKSKIAPTLEMGSAVVTPRFLVRYIVTEYGVADLFGKSLAKRAKALIEIAHPDHREALDKAAFERFGSRLH